MIRIFRENSKYLVEMALINPELCKNKSIRIELEQRDEGPIPHVHVYIDGRNPKKCVYVRLDKPEYSMHHSKHRRTYTFNKAQKQEFIEVMSSIWKKHHTESETTGETRPATGYEMAVRTWLDTYGETVPFNYDEDGFLIMPDYTKL